MSSSKEDEGPGSGSSGVDDDVSEKLEDVERGIPFSIVSWQQGVNADADAEEDGMNRGKNETTRAQYEFGSRR